jgi:hypothetical protein
MMSFISASIQRWCNLLVVVGQSPAVASCVNDSTGGGAGGTTGAAGSGSSALTYCAVVCKLQCFLKAWRIAMHTSTVVLQ